MPVFPTSVPTKIPLPARLITVAHVPIAVGEVLVALEPKPYMFLASFFLKGRHELVDSTGVRLDAD